MSQIIKDEEKLDFEFVPEELPHRGKELKKLDEMYSRVLDSKLARHSLITGRSGYGKTGPNTSSKTSERTACRKASMSSSSS